MQEVSPDHLEVTIIAMDRGVPSMRAESQFTLVLDDVNEFAPEFEQSSYETSAQTTAPNGTYLIQVTAMDRDGRDNRITYSVIPDRSGPEFSIDSNGVLRNNERFPVINNRVSSQIQYYHYFCCYPYNSYSI